MSCVLPTNELIRAVGTTRRGGNNKARTSQGKPGRMRDSGPGEPRAAAPRAVGTRLQMASRLGDLEARSRPRTFHPRSRPSSMDRSRSRQAWCRIHEKYRENARHCASPNWCKYPQQGKANPSLPQFPSSGN
ncbi:uncharacterized protein LOC108253674 [Diaphorina citri]|uniref:Uncharacterized protein LOC108253674 n=1 Tax=Diaphorina citri TaxID=121845 RepID=A0A3Q0JDB7_DIACI|nr:uncharacterized protein LOC108253674 [Diaphorina citri]